MKDKIQSGLNWLIHHLSFLISVVLTLRLGKDKDDNPVRDKPGKES